MKLIRILVTLFFTLLATVAVSAQTTATIETTSSSATAATAAAVTPPTEDHQFWNEFQLVKHTGKKTDLVLIGVLRIGRDWARPVDERVGVGYAFKLNKFLTVMPTYSVPGVPSLWGTSAVITVTPVQKCPRVSRN